MVLRVPGRHRYADEFRGREAVVAALDAIAQATDGTVGAREVHGAAFAPAMAMVHVVMGATRDGTTAQWERVIRYRLTRGRIAEITFFDYDARPLEQLLS